METTELLSDKYLRFKEKDKRRKLGEEMEKMEMEFSEANEKAYEYLESRKDELSSLATDASEETRVRRIEERVARKSVEKSKEDKFTFKEQSVRSKTDLEDLKRQFRVDLFDDGKESDVKPQITGNPTTPTLGQDMWKQLRRVSIPVFSGDKRQYEGWKTAFTACVDKAPATPEYKLLQLRQYLSGEALKCVERLGHSASAYEAAKERLERKCGGKRRQIALHLEELDKFKPIRLGYS